jgi:ABC-type transporter Mla MlaB component
VTALVLAPAAVPHAAGPSFQWDPVRGAGAHTLHLYGRLGPRELAHVVETMGRNARSPRDLVWIDLTEVRHIDYRALPEFTRALLRWRERGAAAWLIGMSDYVRNLFGVAGEGPALARLTWRFGEDPAAPRLAPLESDRSAPAEPLSGRH